MTFGKPQLSEASCPRSPSNLIWSLLLYFPDRAIDCGRGKGCFSLHTEVMSFNFVNSYLWTDASGVQASVSAFSAPKFSHRFCFPSMLLQKGSCSSQTSALSSFSVHKGLMFFFFLTSKTQKPPDSLLASLAFWTLLESLLLCKILCSRDSLHALRHSFSGGELAGWADPGVRTWQVFEYREEAFSVTWRW